MKSVFKILLLMLISNVGYSQTNERIFYDDFVECYYDNNALDSFKVYDEIGGEELISIKLNADKRRWIVVALQETNEGWGKIENIMIAPHDIDSIKTSLKLLKNKWLKMKNLKVHANEFEGPDSLGIPFYSKPDTKSELVCKSGKFLTLTVLATHDLWAKVSFVHNGIAYIAWIERKYQCAYQWTACS
jgi:hypothetical protein